MMTGMQMRAARAMTRWTMDQLAERTKVPVDRIRRAEACDGEALLSPMDAEAIKWAFERAGLQFLDDNGHGPGLRVRIDGQPDEGLRPDQLTTENDL
jgi:hypothetical protein